MAIAAVQADSRAALQQAGLPRPGMRLGRYRLIELLGRGGQGEVWRALQVEPIVEEVAVKLLTAEHADKPSYRAQFHREAMWGARLVSPWLLPTYEYRAESEFVYFAQPLIDGDSLATLLAFRRRRAVTGFSSPRRHWLLRLPRPTYLRAIVSIVARVARALGVAHAARVVHRDVKPANILVDRVQPSGVYLCDFGLGRDLDDPAPVALCHSTGTPLYMAPERLLGHASDEMLCDVYALGVTLSEAATLVSPFAYPTDRPRSAWPEYLAYSTPRRPREVAPWMPLGLQSIIRRAMSRSPWQRYPSMTALAEDLEESLRPEAEVGTGV